MQKLEEVNLKIIFSFKVIAKTLPIVMFTLEPRMVSLQINYKSCHIPLKYKCPTKKSDHVRSIPLN